MTGQTVELVRSENEKCHFVFNYDFLSIISYLIC